MKNFDHILKEALNKTHTIVEQFLSYSRENANRRTLIIVPVVVICLLIPYLLFVRPPSVFPSGELVEIPEGLSLSEIAELLEREQVVRSAVLFRSAVYVFGRERNVKFGDYFFKEPRNVFIIARALSYGVYGLEPIRIRVPEGTMVREMVPLFATYLKRFDEERFLSEAEPMEGYLFPDTYEIPYCMEQEKVVEIMTENFSKKTIGFKITPEAVVMASLLEKELITKEDKKIASGILWKRLRVGMPLQVDVYLWTYENYGLPEKPISNPGLESIEAALNPKESPYFYYLSTPEGKTIFSRTLDEHNLARAKYLTGK